MATETELRSFLDSMITSLSNLVRLEVNTLVGDYTFAYKNGKPEIAATDTSPLIPADKGTRTTIDTDSTSERMCSQINLLTGDITTAMTEKFVVEYKELREYHMIRENQGHEIINRNIEVLKKIVDTIIGFNNQDVKQKS